MSIINVKNLTFSYDGSYDNVFENVSFSVDTNFRLGLIGRNGRGKTTFLNLLRGKYEYSGTISSSVEFEYFPYEVDNKSQNTIDVIEGINSSCEYWEIVKELSLLKVDEDVLYRPFELLSNGEQVKVLLVALFLKENAFLLIDEPTNHLDMDARQTLSDYLKSKKSYILVSHDRDFLDGCVNHILSINKANIEVQKGNFSSWQKNKEWQDGFEIAENERLQKDIKKLNEAAKRTANWSDKVEKTKYGSKNSGLKVDRGYIGHKAAKMMKHSKAIEARQQSTMQEKSKLLKNIENVERLKLSQLDYHANALVGVKDLEVYYDKKTVCKNISFEINKGDRIALIGKNGSGKSSIIKLLLGENIPYNGDVIIGNNLKISYISQDTSHLKGDLKTFSEENRIDESLFKAILRKLDFERTQFDKDIIDFSEGQKKKVLIAKSLCEKAHLYIWDEPLNFIDVYSRISLENLILEFMPTLLFVEHDKKFCKKVVTKEIILSVDPPASKLKAF